MIWLLAFLAGLLIGSFLNVCVYRLPRDLSVVTPARSFCPFCEKTIAWYDNIPVLSFALLGGRCRYCKAKIPVRYLLLELATGAAFALVFAMLGLTPAAIKYCVFSAIVLALIASDFEERILPDEFTLGGIIVGLIFAWWAPVEALVAPLFMPPGLDSRWPSLVEAAFAALFSSGSIWFVGWVYQKVRHREGLGLGDVKMIAMVGAFLGIRGALLTLLFGSLLGSITGLAYIYIARKDAASYELPFGSFLGVAALGCAFYGYVFGFWLQPFGQ